MKFFGRIAGSLLLLACAAVAAIDGKWEAERKLERDGQSFTVHQTFDLKNDGGKLTGTVMMKFGEMEPRTVEIKDGKVEGDKFSFTTTLTTPNGDFKTAYSGTVEGDTLKGTAEREGGQARPFEAKRK